MLFSSIFIFPWLVVTGSSTRASDQAAPQESQQNDTANTGFQGARFVRRALRRAEIIPTVIDDFIPEFYLSARWSSSTHAFLGNTLHPGDLQSAPTISLHSSSPCPSPNESYVIALTDPDAPSRDDPAWSEFCHWIAAGVSCPSSLSLSPTTSGGGPRDVMPYRPPAPPEGTRKHRYAFLAFRPANGTVEPLNLTRPAGRKHWGAGERGYGVRSWAAENGLLPVAANFIYAQHE